MAREPTLAEDLRETKRRRTEYRTAAILDSQAAQSSNPTSEQPAAALNSQAAQRSRPAKETTVAETSTRRRRQTREHRRDYFNTRMGPKLMFDLVQRLSPRQKQAVVETGFGGLLHLQLCTNESKLVQYLLDNFNVCRCDFVLEDDSLHIEEEDVEYTLGIPRGPLKVNEGTKMEDTSTREYKLLLTSWRRRWGITAGSPITTQMPDEIVRRADHGDEFKRDFVVFAVSSMLPGNTTRYSKYRILNSLIDVDMIKEYNWCAYTYQSLIDSIDSYNEDRKRSFWGPMTLILLFYFDRVEFKGMKINRTYPSILAWTTTLVRKRVKAEKRAGGFGKGRVIPRVKKPRTDATTSLQQPASTAAATTSLPQPAFTAAATTSSTPATATPTPTTSEPLSSVDRVTRVLQKLASDVLEFGEAMSEIGKQGAPIEVMKKAFSGISNMLGAASAIESTSIPTESQLDDIFFGSETFTAAVDSLVEAFQKTTRTMEFEAPSFDLGIHCNESQPQPCEQHTEQVVEEDLPLDALVQQIGEDAGLSTTLGAQVTPPLVRVPFQRYVRHAAATNADVDDFDW
ncbi:PREDICTED: uncharacterized protein LOC109178669 [Ipomoea nil]|uniref:uncharacterized protein LOC109178669 n=1 Tax=Ipomoea nil TaxID=35883 RepID=UPI000901DC58|nr:PREDICTED: uncharacterized protein LOC109178669 [Ipomoea nil]